MSWEAISNWFGDALFGAEGGAKSGAIDGVTGGTTGGTTTPRPGSTDFRFPWGDAIKGGLQAISSYQASKLGQGQIGYGNTKEGFEADLALKREELAQRMQLAMMEAEAAGLSRSAQLEAAKIQAGVMMKQIQEKALADAINARIESFSRNQAVLQKSGEASSEAASRFGDTSRLGFGNLAQILQGYRA